MIQTKKGPVKNECIIVDLDGTLANCEHRRHFVTAPNSDWRSFYESIRTDTLNRWCKYLIQSRVDSIDVVIVSGRPERYRGLSEDWLALYQIEYKALFMRKDDDFRKDALVKEEILKEHILPNWNVFFAIDDRSSIVEVWRRNGIVTLQCADGDF